MVNNGTPANQSYDFEFRLCREMTGGQVFTTNQRLNVPVAGGVFTVRLDFGAGYFEGDQKYLEIAVKPAGSSEPFTVLTPHQPLTSAPLAIRSFDAVNAENALRLGGYSVNQIVLATDSRLTDGDYELT